MTRIVAHDRPQTPAALARKAPTQMEELTITNLILDVISLARGQIERSRIALRTELAGDLPPILDDRIQLQQVIGTSSPPKAQGYTSV